MPLSPESLRCVTSAREALAKARLGLADMHSDDAVRRAAGFANVLVWGRAVTNILQGLRSTEKHFNRWYGSKQTEMRDDPLLRRLYELRSQVLKEGSDDVRTTMTLGLTRAVSIEELRPPGPPPPGASGYFIGDRYGRSGWTITLPDGSQAPYYVRVEHPEMSAITSIANPPQSHLGEPLPSSDIESLSVLYLDYLDRLISEAASHFALPIEDPS